MPYAGACLCGDVSPGECAGRGEACGGGAGSSKERVEAGHGLLAKSFLDNLHPLLAACCSPVHECRRRVRCGGLPRRHRAHLPAEGAAGRQRGDGGASARASSSAPRFCCCMRQQQGRRGALQPRPADVPMAGAARSTRPHNADYPPPPPPHHPPPTPHAHTRCTAVQELSCGGYDSKVTVVDFNLLGDRMASAGGGGGGGGGGAHMGCPARDGHVVAGGVLPLLQSALLSWDCVGSTLVGWV